MKNIITFFKERFEKTVPASNAQCINNVMHSVASKVASRERPAISPLRALGKTTENKLGGMVFFYNRFDHIHAAAFQKLPPLLTHTEAVYGK